MREIGRGSSLFLLYGDSGVGKSRLLQQIEMRRLQDHAVNFIDFKNETADNSPETVKAIADSANSSDVIIFDHFEAASNKAQHQIFDIWSTDGLDKKLNLIVCVSTTGFDGFRQLAQQYRIEVKSFQLMPCDEAECEAYLRFHLYPEQPFGKLKIPSAVKRLLRQSNGLYSRLIEIAEREGESINIQQDVRSPVRAGPIVLVFLMTLLVGAAAIFFYLENQQGLVEIPEAEAETGLVESEPINQEQMIQQAIPESNPEPVEESQQEIKAVAELQTEIKSISNPPESSSPESKIEKINKPAPDSLQSRLQATLDWIKNIGGDRGTIQIMSISFDRFDDKAFRAYLNDLSVQGIDVTQIGIFETRVANREVYALIYGNYDSRREANNQISLLPKALAANKPMTRSFGSIATEVARYADN